MKLHFAGKYSKNEENLPQRKHPKNAVQFKEIDNMKKFSSIMNIISILILFFLLIIMYLLTNDIVLELPGIILAFLGLLVHEFLHAVVFKEDVYLYYSFKLSLMFIVGTEDMSKTRYIIMNLLPNIILGFIPFTIFIIHPSLSILGTVGAICISMGIGDYYNIYLALTQMPNGSKTYLSRYSLILVYSITYNQKKSW